MGTIKLVFGIFVIVAVIYLGDTTGSRLIIRITSSRTTSRRRPRWNTYSTKPEDAIRDAIFKKAQGLDIPLTRDQIKVQRHGTQGTGSLIIERALRGALGPARLSCRPAL